MSRCSVPEGALRPGPASSIIGESSWLFRRMATARRPIFNQPDCRKSDSYSLQVGTDLERERSSCVCWAGKMVLFEAEIVHVGFEEVPRLVTAAAHSPRSSVDAQGTAPQTGKETDIGENDRGVNAGQNVRVKEREL